jgi:phage gp36-like protein
MAFLTDEDYNDQVQGTILQEIIQKDATLRTSMENKAQAQITSYLATRYDVPAVFSKSGSSRNMQVVMIMVDMVLYHLHSRISPGQVPQLRNDRYTDAIDWLKMVAAGQLEPDLPKPAGSNTAASKNQILYGSRKARDQYF